MSDIPVGPTIESSASPGPSAPLHSEQDVAVASILIERPSSCPRVEILACMVVGLIRRMDEDVSFTTAMRLAAIEAQRLHIDRANFGDWEDAVRNLRNLIKRG